MNSPDNTIRAERANHFKTLLDNQDSEEDKAIKDFKRKINKHIPLKERDKEFKEPIVYKKGFLDNRTIRLSNGRFVPTLKQKAWMERTIETNNPTQAALEVYNVKDNNKQTAAGIAIDNLGKPYLRAEINRMLEQNGLKLGNTINQHNNIINQNKDIATKLRAVQEHYELIGLHPDDKGKPQVSIGLIVNH